MDTHPFAPVFDENSVLLILGSFPSVKSRAQGFFYGHPRNRFWKVLSGICGGTVPVSIPEKKVFLLQHNIALWDVVCSCDITGSADASIKNVTPCGIPELLKKTKIRKILLNGNKAAELYSRYLAADITIPAARLPSTSPANAAWPLEKLIAAWRTEFI